MSNLDKVFERNRVTKLGIDAMITNYLRLEKELYTAQADADKASMQPKKEWVGLTEEERNVITDKVIGFNSCVGWEDDYAKAIEAALKEKNGG